MTHKFKLVTISNADTFDVSQDCEKENLFTAMKRFNDYAQSLFNKTLSQAELDHDTYSILQKFVESISVAQLLVMIDFTYKDLRACLKTLENKNYISLSGSEKDPASMIVVLTDKGNSVLEKIQQMISAAETDILMNLPRSGAYLSTLLSEQSTESDSVAQDIQLFQDDFAIDEIGEGKSEIQSQGHNLPKTVNNSLENFQLGGDTSVETTKIHENNTPLTVSKLLFVLNEITSAASKKYPDDYSFQLSHIEEEIIAYLKLQELEIVNIPVDIWNTIKAKSSEQEGYQSQLDEIEREVSSYLDLQTLSPVPLERVVFDGICESVKSEYPDSYSTQLFFIEDKIFTYAQIGKLFSVPQAMMDKIKAYAKAYAEEVYSDSGEQRAVINSEIRAYFDLEFRLLTSDIPDDALSIIHAEAKEYYSESLEEYFDHVRQEVSFFRKVRTLADDRVSSTVLDKIKKDSDKNFENSFSYQLEAIEKSIMSYCYIENLYNPFVSSKKLNKIKLKYKELYEDDFSWQLEQIEEQVFSYIKKRKLRKIPSEVFKKIKKSASKEYKDDYSEQEIEVNKQVRDYWKILGLTPQMFHNELEDDLSAGNIDEKHNITDKKESILRNVDPLVIETSVIDEKVCISERNATDLSQWALDSIAKNQGVISLEEAYRFVFGEQEEATEFHKIQQLAKKLSALKIGISPDPRFAFKQQSFDDHAVLFNLSFCKKNPEQENISKNYCTSYLMLHLGMKAAQSDNHIIEAETEVIEKVVLKNPDLSRAEKARLQADMLRLKNSKISLDFIASMLKELSPKHKENMAHLAFRVVAIDDVIEAGELNFLLWLYDQLQFSHAQIRAKIKMIGDLPEKIVRNFPSEMLTTILNYPAEVEGTEEEIDLYKSHFSSPNTMPAPLDTKESDKSLLNEKQVEALREDTNVVQDLLQTIFSEDEDEVETVLFYDVHDEMAIDHGEELGLVSTDIETDMTIEGLDDQHQKLLLSLINMDTHEWHKFEMSAREYGLMASGAVETLNEWGYDKFGEAVIEYDPFYINVEFYAKVINVLSESKNEENDIADDKQESSFSDNKIDSETVVENEKIDYHQFLQDVLAEQNINQERFEEMATSYGLSYDEAFKLLELQM